MSTQTNNKKPTAAQMAAEAAETRAVTGAGQAFADMAEARETNAVTAITAVRAARESSVTGTSDRALATAVHESAVAIRAKSLDLATDAPAVVKGLGLGNVRAYVGAEGALLALGASITTDSARAVYMAVVSGAKVALVKAAEAHPEWAESGPEARAVALVKVADTVAKAQIAKAKATKAEAEAETLAELLEPGWKAEAEAPEGMTKAEAEAYRDGQVIAGLRLALGLVATLAGAEARDLAEALMAEALATLAGVHPDGYGPDNTRRLVTAEADAERYKAEAETLAGLLAEGPMASALVSV